MAFFIPKNDDLANYSCASVYLKSDKISCITVLGKIVSVDCDSYTLTIKTETNTAAFDVQEVIAVNFEK